MEPMVNQASTSQKIPPSLPWAMPTKLWECGPYSPASRKLSSSHPQLVMGTSRGLAPNPCIEIMGDWDYFPTSCWLVWLLSRVQLFCDPMDCSPPGSSVHGIFQARVLEWGAIAFSGISEVIDISPGNLDSSLYFFQPSVSHDVLCI